MIRHVVKSTVFTLLILFTGCKGDESIFHKIEYKVIELEGGTFHRYVISNEYLYLEYCNLDINSESETNCDIIFVQKLKDVSQLNKVVSEMKNKMSHIQPSIDGWEETVRVFKSDHLIKEVTMTNSSNVYVKELIGVINRNIDRDDFKIAMR